MKLHELAPTPGSKKRRMRVGRGDGSGWGGTAGRGHKGQRSRSGASIRHHFEGGQTPTFRRLPKVGFKSGVKTIFNVVNLAAIEKAFEAGAEVDETFLCRCQRENRKVRRFLRSRSSLNLSMARGAGKEDKCFQHL